MDYKNKYLKYKKKYLNLKNNNLQVTQIGGITVKDISNIPTKTLKYMYKNKYLKYKKKYLNLKNNNLQVTQTGGMIQGVEQDDDEQDGDEQDGDEYYDDDGQYDDGQDYEENQDLQSVDQPAVDQPAVDQHVLTKTPYLSRNFTIPISISDSLTRKILNKRFKYNQYKIEESYIIYYNSDEVAELTPRRVINRELLTLLTDTRCFTRPEFEKIDKGYLFKNYLSSYFQNGYYFRVYTDQFPSPTWNTTILNEETIQHMSLFNIENGLSLDSINLTKILNNILKGNQYINYYTQCFNRIYKYYIYTNSPGFSIDEFNDKCKNKIDEYLSKLKRYSQQQLHKILFTTFPSENIFDYKFAKKSWKEPPEMSNYIVKIFTYLRKNNYLFAHNINRFIYVIINKDGYSYIGAKGVFHESDSDFPFVDNNNITLLDLRTIHDRTLTNKQNSYAYYIINELIKIILNGVGNTQFLITFVSNQCYKLIIDLCTCENIDIPKKTNIIDNMNLMCDTILHKLSQQLKSINQTINQYIKDIRPLHVDDVVKFDNHEEQLSVDEQLYIDKVKSDKEIINNKIQIFNNIKLLISSLQQPVIYLFLTRFTEVCNQIKEYIQLIKSDYQFDFDIYAFITEEIDKVMTDRISKRDVEIITITPKK